MKKQSSSILSSVERYVIVMIGIILINIGLLYFFQTQIKIIKLLQEQKIQLEQDQNIINASEEIYSKYRDYIEEILSVFPSEEDVLIFLENLEEVSKQYGNDVVAKFASSSPQTDGDKLFLLFRLTMQTNRENLLKFLEELERLPYMIHLVSLSINSSDGVKDEIYVTANIKLYVKNPFSS